jgi:hypothetical protein
MNTHDDAINAKPDRRRQRLGASIVLVILAGLSQPGISWAEVSNSCKQCGVQRRTCMSNYSGPTCQTEYDRCMKTCQKK